MRDHRFANNNLLINYRNIIILLCSRSRRSLWIYRFIIKIMFKLVFANFRIVFWPAKKPIQNPILRSGSKTLCRISSCNIILMLRACLIVCVVVQTWGASAVKLWIIIMIIYYLNACRYFDIGPTTSRTNTIIIILFINSNNNNIISLSRIYDNIV